MGKAETGCEKKVGGWRRGNFNVKSKLKYFEKDPYLKDNILKNFEPSSR